MFGEDRKSKVVFFLKIQELKKDDKYSKINLIFSTDKSVYILCVFVVMFQGRLCFGKQKILFIKSTSGPYSRVCFSLFINNDEIQSLPRNFINITLLNTPASV